MSGDTGGVKPADGADGAVGDRTEDALLGGRVRFEQFRHGFRSGIEPVLLAATLPARPGSRVLDAGCGAGAALLCASARIPDAIGTGIERDADTARLARDNLRRNGLEHWPVIAAPVAAAAAFLPEGGFDHAVANPPWHAAAATRSPLPRRDGARRAPEGTLAEWCAALRRVLRHRGTLCLAIPAALHAEAAAAMCDTGFGAVTILPLWPRTGRNAKLVLMRGTRGARGPGRLLSGLTLHGTDGGFTADTNRILRDAAALPMD
ncbi:MAG: methyltransferase [Gluconacetobacter diazotrophicus]|nr:methyltransferase [Gluconacetobacter diazotrophicus]